MGWDMPWYSAQDSAGALLAGRQVGMMYLVCYLRHGDRVFETYWTTRRSVEVMDNSYALLDMTIYGRQETWEDSPAGWPQRWEINDEGEQLRTNGRPTAQWSRLEAGRSDDLGAGRRADRSIACSRSCGARLGQSGGGDGTLFRVYRDAGKDMRRVQYDVLDAPRPISYCGTSGWGVKPLGECRAGQGSVRAGQQGIRFVEFVVRVGRVAHALDPHWVAAPRREQLRHLN
jgi:hypothetical protein